MKYRHLLFAISVMSIFAVSCMQKAANVAEKTNGWYLLDTTKTDSIGELIVSVKDFDSLKFEGWKTNSIDDIDSFYVINGKIKASKMKDYADGTEKAIGRGMIFLYNGSIICTPMLNYRIDEGNFAIASPLLGPDKKIMQDMYNSLIEEMKN